MTAADLRKVARAYRRSAARTDDLRDDLAEAIRQARAEGMTIRAIAAEVDLSFQRVAQILKEKP